MARVIEFDLSRRSVREVAGPTCQGVANTAALMVAMTVDPDAAQAAGPPAAPATTAGPAPAPGPATSPAGAPAPGDVQISNWH